METSIRVGNMAVSWNGSPTSIGATRPTKPFERRRLTSFANIGHYPSHHEPPSDTSGRMHTYPPAHSHTRMDENKASMHTHTQMHMPQTHTDGPHVRTRAKHTGSENVQGGFV